MCVERFSGDSTVSGILKIFNRYIIIRNEVIRVAREEFDGGVVVSGEDAHQTNDVGVVTLNNRETSQSHELVVNSHHGFFLADSDGSGSSGSAKGLVFVVSHVNDLHQHGIVFIIVIQQVVNGHFSRFDRITSGAFSQTSDVLHFNLAVVNGVFTSEATSDDIAVFVGQFTKAALVEEEQCARFILDIEAITVLINSGNIASNHHSGVSGEVSFASLEGSDVFINHTEVEGSGSDITVEEAVGSGDGLHSAGLVDGERSIIHR